jgi:predicted Rossmann fold nucleotide-binding protein DprA/Smf involved in DNA uptake
VRAYQPIHIAVRSTVSFEVLLRRSKMRIAIVGSRRRKDKEKVTEYVNSLPMDSVIISGGCEGVDTWAIEAATDNHMKWKVIYPDMSGVKTYYDRCKRYYDRNEKVVKDSDVVVAFVARDRKGGTENTITWAKKHKKPVVIMNEELPENES